MIVTKLNKKTQSQAETAFDAKYIFIEFSSRDHFGQRNGHHIVCNLFRSL
jgi:hypothetical protein